MSCSEFRLWLDEGRPEGISAAMEAHAAECPSCARSLHSAFEIEAAFRAPREVTAPVDFTAEVMRRVRATATAGPFRPVTLFPALSWWLRAAADPAVACAFALAAILAWRFPAWWNLAGRVASGVGAVAEAVFRSPGLPPVLARVGLSLHSIWNPVLLMTGNPAALLGIFLAVLPAELWISWRLYRWAGRI